MPKAIFDSEHTFCIIPKLFSKSNKFHVCAEKDKGPFKLISPGNIKYSGPDRYPSKILIGR